MTFLHIVLAVGYAVAFGGGYYAHYRWGAKVAADVAKVKAVV